MVTKRRRRWRIPADRREALARMNHPATAEISHRHGMEGWNGTASGVSAPKTTTTEASAASVIATSFRLRNQSRARKKRDPIEFSFHDLDFLSVLLNYLRPPAIRSVSPVIQTESAEARKTAAGAISSVWPMRPSGVCDSKLLRKSL